MSRARRRADRINEAVPILDVLATYGYQVSPGYDGEQQFRCDLHGSGTDNKPSARAYPHSNSTYCFGCDRTRDPIAYVMEKEGVGFMDAVERLEKAHGLPPLPWDDDDAVVAKAAPRDIVGAVEGVLDPTTTLAGVKHRVQRFLENVTRDRDLDMDSSTRMWEAFDKVLYLVEYESLHETKAQQVLLDLLHRAKQRLTG